MVSIRDIPKNEKHKKALTIRVDDKFAGFPRYVKNFRIKNDKIIIPRVYAFEKLKWVPKFKEFKTHENLGNFNGEMRDYQSKIIKDTTEQFKTFPGVILSIYTGGGKTAMALKLISILKLKTLIVVNKKILSDQWKSQIELFLPDAKIGLIQGKIFDIEEITICTLQTISKISHTIKHSKEDYKQFDFVIFDEIHNINSSQFSNALFLISSFYMLGLSATPKRKDGLHVISTSHIGPIKLYENNNKIVPEIHIHRMPKVVIKTEMTKTGKLNLSRLMTDISENEICNEYIVSKVVEYLKEDRTILILCSRVEQCKTLCEMTLLTESVSCSFIAGKMSTLERNEAILCQVVYSTYNSFSEGVDKSDLDTLILASSRVEVVQSVGRILRRINKNKPVVADLLFNHGVLMNQYYRRNRFYKKSGFVVKHIKNL
jgi:superfamily II DNA or RNA helicase